MVTKMSTVKHLLVLSSSTTFSDIYESDDERLIEPII